MLVKHNLSNTALGLNYLLIQIFVIDTLRNFLLLNLDSRYHGAITKGLKYESDYLTKNQLF